jgi:hypothetical protein
MIYRPLAPQAPRAELAVTYRRDERSAVLPAFLEVLHEVIRQRPQRAVGARTP